jgi:Methylamine utilisation protein MauE
VLGVAALLKLSRPRESVASLLWLGLPSARGRGVVLTLVVGAELALAAGVAAGWDMAAYAAAGLLIIFAAALAAAVRAGRRGAPCACFGRGGRVGPLAVARNVLLAAAFAALPVASSVELSSMGWLTVGLAVALAAVGALTVAVLALAREVGMLRLRLPPGQALELLSEGPELGRVAPIVDRLSRFPIGAETRVALAVFTSPGCRLCEALRPAVAAVSRDPRVAVGEFGEERDREAWTALAVPGSPYAVAIDLDGIVRAKGTFNSLAQLETIVAAAEQRLGAEAPNA